MESRGRWRGGEVRDREEARERRKDARRSVEDRYESLRTAMPDLPARLRPFQVK